MVEIADNGDGMSEEFIRERLFKPFDSTKSAGMGIGVFESREYITSWAARWTSTASRRRHHVHVRAAARRAATPLATAHPEARMTETRNPLLIIEDDPGLQKQLRWAFDAYEASSPATARRRWPRSAATSRPWSRWTWACRPTRTVPTEGLGC